MCVAGYIQRWQHHDCVAQERRAFTADAEGRLGGDGRTRVEGLTRNKTTTDVTIVRVNLLDVLVSGKRCYKQGFVAKWDGWRDTDCGRGGV